MPSDARATHRGRLASVRAPAKLARLTRACNEPSRLRALASPRTTVGQRRGRSASAAKAAAGRETEKRAGKARAMTLERDTRLGRVRHPRRDRRRRDGRRLSGVRHGTQAASRDQDHPGRQDHGSAVPRALSEGGAGDFTARGSPHRHPARLRGGEPRARRAAIHGDGAPPRRGFAERHREGADGDRAGRRHSARRSARPSARVIATDSCTAIPRARTSS